MKIKLIDRYGFTKFIDSDDADTPDEGGTPSEVRYETSQGMVRFVLTGETRADVPYYMQSPTRPEHSPAYAEFSPSIRGDVPQEPSESFNLQALAQAISTVPIENTYTADAINYIRVLNNVSVPQTRPNLSREEQRDREREARAEQVHRYRQSLGRSPF